MTGCDTFQSAVSFVLLVGFGVNLNFKWDQMSRAELSARKRPVDPIRCVLLFVVPHAVHDAEVEVCPYFWQVRIYVHAYTSDCMEP